MGEWKEAYIESKDSELVYEGETRMVPHRCWGAMDRQGKCENTFVSLVRVYCDDCIRYFKSGEWKNK